MKPGDTIRISKNHFKYGKDTISVTGNILHCYLTGIYPIIGLGISFCLWWSFMTEEPLSEESLYLHKLTVQITVVFYQ